MTKYILRRLLQSIPLLFLISVVVFALLQSTPGGPLARFENNPTITEADLQTMRERMGLNDPLHIRYIRWLWNTLHADFGESYITHQPVAEMIAERLPNTFRLMLPAFILTLLMAAPIGIISAIKQYSFFDHLVTTFTFAGQSIPIFWFGLLLIIFFYGKATNPWTGEHLFPPGGIYSLDKPGDFWDGLWHMVLPVSMLSLAWVSWYTRFLRTSMLDTIRQDYIRTARAKGLKKLKVYLKHALPNAIMPMITLVTLDLASLFAGAVYTETIFSWPGMGRLFYQSALRRDYPVLMAVVMITAVLIVFSNLLADILYAYADPRIRYD
ncbi:MAG: ABC transporter permease [Chloroflexi bacterium]|nr:ABC transporter permease [Chloroflexota bacterium]